MLSPARFLCRLFSSSPNTNPDPNISNPLRLLIKRIIKEKDPDALVSLFNISSSDPRFRIHSPIYSIAVRRLSSAGRPDAVESLIEHQKTHPDFARCEHFAARLILLYGRAGLLDHALATFRSITCPRTSLSLNALLTCYAHAEGTSDPRTLAGLIEEVQLSYPDVSPSVVSYNIIVNVLCGRGEFEQAMDVVGLMERKGILPNLVTYNTLLHGFYSRGRFEVGERIWDRMAEKDVRSYNSRLRGLVLEGRLMDAVEVFGEMHKSGVKPDVYSFNALIRGYCQEGMLEEAKKVYLGLEKSGLEKSGCDPDLMTYTMLIPKFLEAKEFDFVVRLCNESINIGCYLDVKMLQGVVDELAKEEMFAKAKKLVKHVRSKEFYGSKCLRLPLPCLVA